MRNLYWLSEDQMAPLRPCFPKSHGLPHVDDRRVLSGITLINRNGLRWGDLGEDHGGVGGEDT
jgi:transposase